MGCIHNPKVGGSIPPPATNILNEINILRHERIRVHGPCGGKMGQEMYE